MEQYALYNDPRKGPTFGFVNEPDLGIDDKANESESSYTSFGNVYAIPYNTSKEEAIKILSSGVKFKPEVVEVFYQGMSMIQTRDCMHNAYACFVFFLYKNCQ